MSATRSALLFSFTEKYALMLIGLGGSMVLARLLTPREVGVYSVAAVLVGLLHVLRDFGIGQYLVQERALDTARLRAVLAASLLLAWPLAALIAGASGVAARFYGEPRLLPVLQLMALNFALLPFSALALPMLRRALRFGAICAINLSYGLAHLAVGVLLAWQGFGFMSLAWAALAGNLAALLASLCLRPPGMPWRPACTGLRAVLGFGLYATGGNLVDEAGTAAPDLIIGKSLGMDAVGIFGKAGGVLAVFHQAIGSAVAPVVYALYAERARSDGDVGDAYLRTVGYMTAFAWPFYAFVALMAAPIVRLLYGDQWDATVPLIRIMCCSSALYSMSSMARYLFLATGHVKTQARIDTLAVPPRVAALLLAAPHGLTALAWAVVFGSVARAWLTLYHLRRCQRIALADIARHARASVLLAALVALPPGVMLAAGTPDLARLALAALLSLLLWLAGIALLRHALFDELLLARRKLAASLSW